VDRIDRIYRDVKESILAELSPAGFELFRDEVDGPFGSNYIELHRGREAIRFVWDGKESWFVLERCPDTGLEPHPSWKDVRFERIKLSDLDAEMSKQLFQVFREAIGGLASEYRAA
jgi:hypothetical protein